MYKSTFTSTILAMHYRKTSMQIPINGGRLRRRWGRTQPLVGKSRGRVHDKFVKAKKQGRSGDAGGSANSEMLLLSCSACEDLKQHAVFTKGWGTNASEWRQSLVLFSTPQHCLFTGPKHYLCPQY